MAKYRILWISLIIFFLDHLTKWIVKLNMHLYESIPVWGDFFRLTYVENSGMAFGISVGNNVFFTIFAVVASIAILIYLFQIKSDHRIARLAMALIFGGALGNLADRITRGQVVDFLDFEFLDIHIPAFKFLFIQFRGYELERWPVFNVADIAVTVGMFILLTFILLEKEPNPDDPAGQESEIIQ